MRASKELSEKIDQVLSNAVLDTQIPKEVLMRKKWMNALYQHVVASSELDRLPPYLLGWRYRVLTQPLIEVLRQELDDHA
mgnify:FL=1